MPAGNMWGSGDGVEICEMCQEIIPTGEYYGSVFSIDDKDYRWYMSICQDCLAIHYKWRLRDRLCKDEYKTEN